MITLPRGTWKDVDQGRPGPYWIGPVRQTKKGDTANVVCGKGHVGLIDEHAISDNGTVSPSVVCTEIGCGWHEHVQLIGWAQRNDPP